MKIQNITELKKAGLFDLFKEEYVGWYEGCTRGAEVPFESIIAAIAANGGATRNLSDGWHPEYVITYKLHVNDDENILEVKGRQEVINDGEKGDRLGRIRMDEYITLSLSEEGLVKEKARIDSEVERILEVIEIDKEDGFTSRSEHNVSKELVQELKNKGLSVKTELREGSRTGTSTRVAIINW